MTVAEDRDIPRAVSLGMVLGWAAGYMTTVGEWFGWIGTAVVVLMLLGYLLVMVVTRRAS